MFLPLLSQLSYAYTPLPYTFWLLYRLFLQFVGLLFPVCRCVLCLPCWRWTSYRCVHVCVLCLPCWRWTSYGCAGVCCVYLAGDGRVTDVCRCVLCLPCWRWTSYGCAGVCCIYLAGDGRFTAVQVCIVFTLLEMDDLRLQSRPVDSCVSGLRSGTCGGTRLTHTPV